MFTFAINVLLVCMFSLTVTSYVSWFTVVCVQTGFALIRYNRRDVIPAGGSVWKFYKDLAPPLSVIIPAFNESKTIIDTIEALRQANYTHFEIIVVNDGSDDPTLAILNEKFDLVLCERPFERILLHQKITAVYQSRLCPEIFVLDKHKGGKADAQNAGINFSRNELVCMVDADTIVAAEALLRLVKPFIENPNMVAVGGTIMVANGCRVQKGRLTRAALKANLLIYFQALEYLRAFLIFRVGVAQMKLSMLVSGAFGVFSKKSLLEISGYTNDLASEDLDLIMKMHSHKRATGEVYAVDFVPDAICWTEVPERLRDLSKQRRRWHRGALESIFKYRRLMLAPRYGRVGFLGLPAMLLVDIFLPLLTGLSYIWVPLALYTEAISPSSLLAFTSVILSYGVLLSFAAIALEQVQLKRSIRLKYIFYLGLASLIEGFGYRQLNHIWRLIAIFEFFKGKQSWGSPTRVGFNLDATKKR